jgi:hypothetical protein
VAPNLLIHNGKLKGPYRDELFLSFSRSPLRVWKGDRAQSVFVCSAPHPTPKLDLEHGERRRPANDVRRPTFCIKRHKVVWHWPVRCITLHASHTSCEQKRRDARAHGSYDKVQLATATSWRTARVGVHIDNTGGVVCTGYP